MLLTGLLQSTGLSAEIPISTAPPKSSSERTDTPLPESLAELRLRSQAAVESLRTHGLDEQSLARQQHLLELLENLTRFSRDEATAAQATEEERPAGEAPVEQPPGREVADGTSPSDTAGSPAGPGDRTGDSAGQAAVVPPPSATESLPHFGREQLADAVWGHLPPIERQELLQSYSEAFLPGYEDQVRRYFERLARLRQSTPPRQPLGNDTSPSSTNPPP